MGGLGMGGNSVCPVFLLALNQLFVFEFDDFVGVSNHLAHFLFGRRRRRRSISVAAAAAAAAAAVDVDVLLVLFANNVGHLFDGGDFFQGFVQRVVVAEHHRLQVAEGDKVLVSLPRRKQVEVHGLLQKANLLQ